MAVPRETDLDGLIGNLYDAAVKPELWGEWMASAAKCFGSYSGLSVVRDSQSGVVDLLGAHNITERALQLYGEYYHQHDIWVQRAGDSLMKATISADLCSDEEFANSEIYADFCKPHAGDQFYVVGAVLPVEAGISVIGFQNARGAAPFTRTHAQALDRLLPHLQRALLIRARLVQMEARSAASESALDALNYGVLLLTFEANVIYANRIALRILEENDGISLDRKGILAASKPSDTSVLQTIIASCRKRGGGGAMALSRPSALRPLEIIAAPLSGMMVGSLLSKSSVLLFLRDPEARPRPIPEVLSSLYRLTAAEGRLAADLLGFQTLEEIAERRQLSRETLRTQLKELFRKTGTSRQAELIGFLTAGLATLLNGNSHG